MRSLILLTALLVACGGSSRAGAFDEEIDVGSADVTSGDAEDDTTPVDDSAPSVDGSDAPPPTDSGSKPDVAPPKDDAPIGCPSGMTSVPTKCPEICNGGCVADACRILCNTLSSCGARRIDCPPGMKCLVECSGLSSCGSLDLRCPETGSCALQCTGTSSCGSVQMRCPKTASCAISCGGLSSCNGGQVACGSGPCSSECTAAGSGLAAVNCGPSCMCNKKCG